MFSECVCWHHCLVIFVTRCSLCTQNKMFFYLLYKDISILLSSVRIKWYSICVALRDWLLNFIIQTLADLPLSFSHIGDLLEQGCAMHISLFLAWHCSQYNILKWRDWNVYCHSCFFFMLGYFVKGKNIFMLDLLQQTNIFSLQKTLIDRPESCLITCGLLFGLSFWQHPSF